MKIYVACRACGRGKPRHSPAHPALCNKCFIQFVDAHASALDGNLDIENYRKLMKTWLTDRSRGRVRYVRTFIRKLSQVDCYTYDD